MSDFTTEESSSPKRPPRYRPSQGKLQRVLKPVYTRAGVELTSPQAGSGEHVMEQRTANREPRLFGRTHELAALWSQWEATIAGRLHVALVAGEPGIGKTRLLQEIAEGAEGPPQPRGCHPICPFWRLSAATSARLPLSNSAPRLIPSPPSWRRFCQSCRCAWVSWHPVTRSHQSRRACSWTICTGPTPPPSTCSAMWLSIKRSPASASWALTARMNWRAVQRWSA